MYSKDKCNLASSTTKARITIPRFPVLSSHWSNHQTKHFPPPKRNKPPFPRLLPDNKGSGDPNLSPSLHGPHPLRWTKISFSFFHIYPPFQRQETGVWENIFLGADETRRHRKKIKKAKNKAGKHSPKRTRTKLTFPWHLATGGIILLLLSFLGGRRRRGLGMG